MKHVHTPAQVQGIPVVAFDVGGVGEMLNTTAAADIIVAEPTAEALAAKLAEVHLPSLRLLKLL